jgi:hypothetical protein
MVDDTHVHVPDPNGREPHGAHDRRMAMLVDTNAIRALGSRCSNHADDLSAAAATLKSLPGPEAASAFGAVGARFLATLADATAAEAHAIAALGESLASASPRAAAVADAYTETDRRGSRLL